jgi:hypothetical protein
MIHLLFSTSTAWQSAVIRRICHSPFSHLDVVLPDGNLLGSSDSPKAPHIEGNPRGVAVRPPEYQEFGIRRLAKVRVGESASKMFMELVRSQLGKPFDGEALNAFLSGDVTMPRDWRADDQWICSELMAWAAEGANFWNYDLLVPKNRISPADLLLLLNPLINTETFWDPVPGIKPGPHEYLAVGGKNGASA